jgi:hypothetical protein
MKVIGREISDGVDRMYREVEARVAAASRDLKVEPFEGEGLSSVKWSPKAVTISLHSGVPTHALPHVLGIALQHVRQDLDGYPNVRKPKGRQPQGSDLVRSALRELVLEPDAEAQLTGLGLDREWEQEQRHQAMKDLLRDPPEDWNEEGSLGCDFIALQVARLEVTHPPKMYEALRKRVEEALPVAAERADLAGRALKRRRWGTASACLHSLVNVRDELGLADLATITDGAGREH